jgi:hypothetical protein
MRCLSRLACFAAIALALAGATCRFPTDKSDAVFVTLVAPSGVVLRGQDVDVYARAWRVLGTDTQSVANVDFAFYTSSSATARVEETCCGYATVTGVNSGVVNIVARAVAFERATQGDLVLRVSDPLEIDSVRPAPVRHGQVVTVYGVGVDSMFLASLAGVTLIEYPFSRARDPLTGFGRISFWVPPPARSDQLFYLGAGVFGTAVDTTDVVFEDVFEPNDTVASFVDLDLGGPWPGTVLAPILFLNPGLAFEPQPRDVEGDDWFKFERADTTRPTTFFVNYPSFGQDTLTRTFLLDSLGFNGAFQFDDSVTLVGSKWHICKNSTFQPEQVSRESTVVALKELPSPRMSIITFFSHPQRYGLTVVDGYITADPRIVADRFEENDFCTFADRPAQRIVLGANQGVADTLTIDNAFEIDWYRLDVTPGAFQSVFIATRARPFVVGRDSSDIDVYVLTVPGSTGSGVDVIAKGVNAGSNESLGLALAAGSYYVAVTDFAGVATRYSMCVRVALSGCTPPAAPPVMPGAPRARTTSPVLSGAAPAVRLAPTDPLGRVRRP